MFGFKMFFFAYPKVLHQLGCCFVVGGAGADSIGGAGMLTPADETCICYHLFVVASLDLTTFQRGGTRPFCSVTRAMFSPARGCSGLSSAFHIVF